MGLRRDCENGLFAALVWRLDIRFLCPLLRVVCRRAGLLGAGVTWALSHGAAGGGPGARPLQSLH